MPDRVPKPALSERSGEVLALLWAAGQRGQPLKWGYSKTIELSLMDRHVPPLAEHTGGGYAITVRGRDLYREWYATHTAVYPDVAAPHPDGVSAEPWPKRADEILTQHRRYYEALCTAWQAARTADQSAQTEAGADPPPMPAVLPRRSRRVVDHPSPAMAGHSPPTGRSRGRRHGRSSGPGRKRRPCLRRRGPGRVPRGRPAPRPAVGAPAAQAKRRLGRATPTAAARDRDPRHRRGGRQAAQGSSRCPRASAWARAKQRRSRFTIRVDKPKKPGSSLAELAEYLHGQVCDGALTRRLHPTDHPGPAC